MNSVESLIAYWEEWGEHERLRRRRADLQRRAVIEWLIDFYDGAWDPRYSLLLDRSVVAEEERA